MPDFLKQDEKKVEYIELIYDLIFVYIIGRNNSLVQHVSGGFIDAGLYVTYLLCTLITIQIWYSTTQFINRYGCGSFVEYIGLFINMYLLYYMGDGTRVQWQDYFYRYNIAWALILINLIVQYLIKKRKIRKTEPWKSVHVMQYVFLLGIQVAVIAVGIGVYALTGLPLTPLAMVFGIVAAVATRNKVDLVALDFSHLTERVMLYIVFTFGEMIIAIASYFSGDLSFTNIFFSLMAFLIVVGLFISYGFLYDRLLDREMSVSGNGYMIIHIFIILALSNLTTALEFMHEPEVALLPKTIYLTVSFVAYYIFLFLLAPFTKSYHYKNGKLWRFVVTIIAFIGLMALLYQNMYFSITIAVALTFAIWRLEYLYWKEHA